MFVSLLVLRFEMSAPGSSGDLSNLLSMLRAGSSSMPQEPSPAPSPAHRQPSPPVGGAMPAALQHLFRAQQQQQPQAVTAPAPTFPFPIRGSTLPPMPVGAPLGAPFPPSADAPPIGGRVPLSLPFPIGGGAHAMPAMQQPMSVAPAPAPAAASAVESKRDALTAQLKVGAAPEPSPHLSANQYVTCPLRALCFALLIVAARCAAAAWLCCVVFVWVKAGRVSERRALQVFVV